MTRRRTVRAAAPRPAILVLTEGTKTEPDYLKHWHRLHRFTITVEVRGVGADPTTLVDQGIAALKAARQDERRGRGSAYTSGVGRVRP